MGLVLLSGDFMYGCLDDQNKLFISILSKNSDLMSILDYISDLGLPNFYIAAGSVFQTIWNYYDGVSLTNGIKDIDIIYYDSNNLSKECENKLEDKIVSHFSNFDYEFDVHNEARMHLWKKKNENKDIDQYVNSEDAIYKWIATVHAVGITKVNGVIKVYAPYGLSDIFSRTIRPIKHKYNSKELYDKKVHSWCSRFDNLNVIEW